MGCEVAYIDPCVADGAVGCPVIAARGIIHVPKPIEKRLIPHQGGIQYVRFPIIIEHLPGRVVAVRYPEQGPGVSGMEIVYLENVFAFQRIGEIQAVSLHVFQEGVVLPIDCFGGIDPERVQQDELRSPDPGGEGEGEVVVVVRGIVDGGRGENVPVVSCEVLFLCVLRLAFPVAIFQPRAEHGGELVPLFRELRVRSGDGLRVNKAAVLVVSAVYRAFVRE